MPCYIHYLPPACSALFPYPFPLACIVTCILSFSWRYHSRPELFFVISLEISCPVALKWCHKRIFIFILSYSAFKCPCTECETAQLSEPEISLFLEIHFILYRTIFVPFALSSFYLDFDLHLPLVCNFLGVRMTGPIFKER